MKISIYTLFQIIAIAIGAGIINLFLYEPPVYYVNKVTIFITISLILIVVLQLFDAKRNENPLLLVLTIWLTLYVILRVFTLQYTDISQTLLIHDASVEDFNNGLLLTTLFTIVMWAGLHYNRFHYKKKSDSNHKNSGTNVVRALKFYWLSLFIWGVAAINIPLISGFASILSMYFLYQSAVFFVFLLFVINNWSGLSSKYKLLSILSLLAFALMMTASGSRSGFFLIIRSVLFVVLAMGINKIKIKYLLYLTLFVPVLVVIFMYSTYMRQTGVNIEGSLYDKIELAKRFYNSRDAFISKEMIAPVFTRVGYIDYTVIYVKDKEFYSQIINVSDEVKSVIDNVLSPGFDVFDTPKISVMASPWYNDHVKVSKSNISIDDYSSSQFTMVGEYTVLFGIPLCFLFFFLTAFAFRYVWCKSMKSELLSDIIKKTYCLYFLDVLLSSYGLDWFSLDTVCNILTISVFLWFISSGRKKVRKVIRVQNENSSIGK